MATKTIPNDMVAEQSVLGAMFLSKLAIEKATEKLITPARAIATNLFNTCNFIILSLL